MRSLLLTTTLLLASSTLGCDGGSEKLTCDAGLVPFRGACVDPVRRYEPETQLDLDNVVAYGDPLSDLELPPPPKSGFRIVAPPRVLEPGQEVDFCLSWPIPEVTHHIVHAGRLHTTPGLHHSNMIAKPVDKELGENPYPNCHPNAENPLSNIGAGIPDVLFANSTQIVGEETIVFPEGMGFRLDPTREITTDIHFLNSTGEAVLIELAYDFFTMPEEELVQEVAPFVVQIEEFSVPPHTTEAVGATCKVFGGRIVSFMPHTHDLAQRFTVDLFGPGGANRVYDDGAFDLESDIRSYDPGIDIDGVESIRHECLFQNTRDIEVHYGLGLHEMCVLFGYVYPPEKQFTGIVSKDGGGCNSLQIGLFR
jgi:hypothetical protein